MSGGPASASFREKVWQVVLEEAGELFSSFTITYENEYPPEPPENFKPEYAEAVRFLISLQMVRYLIYWLVLVLAD